MFDAYKVSVKLSLINDVSRGLFKISKEFTVLNTQAQKFNTILKESKSLMLIGGSLIGAGVTIASPFIFAIEKAAELQKQMVGIQLATRGTTTEMDAMRASIENISSKTIFNNIDVAKMAKTIATGTGLGAKDISSLIPEYAKFADVQYLMKGASAQDSVKEAVKLAHLANRYDAKSLASYLNLLNKASFIVPGSLSEVGHALKYSQTMSKTALGMDDETSVLLVSLLNRLGFSGSRGGTNLIAAMTRTIPGIFGSGLLKGKSNEALKAMGFVDKDGRSVFMKDGKFDAFSWMKGLSTYVQKEFAKNSPNIARQHVLTNFNHAFGVQGSRVASLLASPQALEQLRAIGTTFAGLQGTTAMQETFAETTSQKFLNAKNNFVTALTELGMTLLPAATKALSTLNNQLMPLIAWLRNNQQQAKKLAIAFVSLSGALLFSGVVLTLASAFRVLGGVFMISKGIGLIGAIITLTGAFGSLVAIGAAVTTAIYGIYKAFKFFTSLYQGTSNSSNPVYVQDSQKNLQVNLHVNGQKLFQATTNYMEKNMSKAPNYGSFFDPSMTLANTMMNR